MPEQKDGSRGLLATIAITAGVVALGVYALDLHAHTCANCGHRWRHLGAFNLGDEESHTCGRCGQVQWWKCGTPHVLRGSQFVASPALPSAPALPLFAHGTERTPLSPAYGRTRPSLPYERMGYERSSFGPAYDDEPLCEVYEQHVSSGAYEQLPSRTYEEAQPYRSYVSSYEEPPPYRRNVRSSPSRTYEETPRHRANTRLSPSHTYERTPSRMPYERALPSRSAYQRAPSRAAYERHQPSSAYAALMTGTGDWEGCR
jgi:hypothetical protein